MSYENNLFTLLTGTPTPGGTWTLKSITGSGAPSSVKLNMAEGSPAGTYYDVDVASLPSPVLNPNGGSTDHNLWWKPIGTAPYSNNPATCNTSWVYTFTYTPPASLCNNPPTADIVWTLYTSENGTTNYDVCEGTAVFSMQSKLTGCGATAPNGGTWTIIQDNGNPDAFDLDAGTFNPLDAEVTGGQTYIAKYTVDIDGAGTCADCIEEYTLEIDIIAGSSAGEDGEVTTCI